MNSLIVTTLLKLIIKRDRFTIFLLFNLDTLLLLNLRTLLLLKIQNQRITITINQFDDLTKEVVISRNLYNLFFLKIKRTNQKRK